VTLVAVVPRPDSTSAGGAMLARRIAPPAVVGLVLSGFGTAARPTDPTELVEAVRGWNALQQTTAGLSEVRAVEDARAALFELRRLSGLTFEQLARLFRVNRRTLHFWASGKPLTPANEERLHRIIGVIRRIDRGSGATTRAALFAPHRGGRVVFDLLVDGHFEEAVVLVGPGTPERRVVRRSLSEQAKLERRPPPPEQLVDAHQERIALDPGVVRPAKSVRIRGDR